MKINVFVLSFFALLVLSSFFASAFWSELGNADFIGAFNSLKDVNSSIDTTWSAQVLLFFLVLVVIFGVSDYIPFLGEKQWISFIFSTIVAILAVFYLNPQQVADILFSYKTLGIVLTAVIPFFVIAAVSKKAYEKGNTILAKALWLAFIVILLYMVSNASAKVGGARDLQMVQWAYWITIIASILMFFIEKWLYFKLFKANMQGDVDKSKKLLAATITSKIESIDDRLPSASPKVAAELQNERARLVAELAKIR